MPGKHGALTQYYAQGGRVGRPRGGNTRPGGTGFAQATENAYRAATDLADLATEAADFLTPRIEDMAPAYVGALSTGSRVPQMGREYADWPVKEDQLNIERMINLMPGADIATAAIPLSRLSRAVPDGALGMFVGRNARTANMGVLADAQQMAEEGEDPETIWQATGWMRGAEGKWRFEVSDRDAAAGRLPLKDSGAPGVIGSVGDVLKHKNLFEAYPDLAGIKIVFDKAPGGARGAYVPPTRGRPEEIIVDKDMDMADLRTTILHELQHAIQRREAFATGGSPSEAAFHASAAQKARLVSIQEDKRLLRERIGKASSGGFAANVTGAEKLRAKELAAQGRNLLALLDQAEKDVNYDLYRQLAGEVEAWNVEFRQFMSPELGRAVYPGKTATYPVDQQIVAMDDSAVSAAVDDGGIRRVPARLPGTKNPADDPLDRTLRVDREAARRAPEQYEYNLRLLTEMPGLRNLRSASDAKEIEEAVNKHFSDNIAHLIDLTPDLVRERTKQWYKGAQRVAQSFGKRYGQPDEVASGVIAALSPGKDWYQNVSMAERVFDINAKRQMFIMNKDMQKTANRLFGQDPAKRSILEGISNRSLGELEDPVERAAWIRIYDETFNPPRYRGISPEGDFGDFARTKSGQERKQAWQSLPMIAKAVQIMDTGGDLDGISALLGSKHKIRSFNNNILDPDNPFEDFTSDTHNVAAASMLPLSQKSPQVSRSFGTSTDKGVAAAKNVDKLGLAGTYSTYADAGRDAAKRFGMLPREAQSVSWEAIRSIFSDVFKRSKGANVIEDIWSAYERGEISADAARRSIVDAAGGYKAPGSVRSGSDLLAPEEHSTYR